MVRRRSAARAAFAVAAAAALGTSLACCEQALSIDGPVVVQGTALACGIPVPSGGCERCVAAQCCSQASACAGDPACLALESCLLGCGSDYACRATCVASNPVGDQADVPTLDQCVAAACGSDCGLLCGQAGSYTAPENAQECQQCIEAHSCEPTLACTQDLQCELTGHCVYSCVTQDCRAACIAQGGSEDVFVDTVLDVGIPCYAACGVGRYWSCIGKISWPLAKSTSEDVTLRLTDANPNHGAAAFPGLVVKACDPGDAACSAPIAAASTDANGSATLTLPPLPQHAYGFQGYFDLSSASQQIPPVLYFLSFPLSEPHAQLDLALPSATDFQQSMALVNVTPDPQRGHVAVVVLDCLLVNAPDVTVTADGTDGEVRELYRAGAQPSATATATDGTGVVYFFNVAPGAYTFHATPTKIGRVSSTVHALVRAGALSVVTALPTAP